MQPSNEEVLYYAARYRTGDQSLVRQMNLSVIMYHLWEGSPTTRAALAAKTGLNKTTVSSLVEELIRQGFVQELGRSSPGAGRPGVLLRLNPAAGCVVAAEIGVDFIAAICTSFSAEPLWRRREAIGPGAGQAEIIARVSALIGAGVHAGQKANGALLGVAVGLPGLVDRSTGTLIYAPNLNWRDIPFRAVMQESLAAQGAASEVPVFVDNEASFAALGEHFFGAAHGYDEVLYLSLGAGLGGGMLRGGQLYKGATGFAGEFGHLTLKPHGRPCSCGNIGCWETLVNQAALLEHVHALLKEGSSSRLTSQPCSVPAIVEAAAAGDGVALAAFDHIGKNLGIGIAGLINALNPELVVVGGALSPAVPWMMPALKREATARALRWSAQATKITAAEIGLDACMMGGVATVCGSILAQPGIYLSRPARPEWGRAMAASSTRRLAPAIATVIEPADRTTAK